jgi:hypothetical protein
MRVRVPIAVLEHNSETLDAGEVRAFQKDKNNIEEP